MKAVSRFFFLFLLIFLVTSCGGKEEPILAPLSSGEISGERLWDRISSESDYRSYSQWAGHEGMQPGQSPHGALHEVFANRTIYEALPVSTGEVPPGSILVKENYTVSRELDKLTVMVKVEGFSPENGDWFWAAFSPEGDVLAEGIPGGCLSCHGGMQYNDYIIIKNIDEP